MPSFEPGLLYGFVGGLLSLGVLYIAGGRTAFAFSAGIVVGLLIATGIMLYHEPA